MLYNLLAPLADQFIFFNVFRYLTFRTGAAVITALVISFIFGPMVIDWLRSRQGKGQPIRDDGPERHIVAKQGTPTMGTDRPGRLPRPAARWRAGVGTALQLPDQHRRRDGRRPRSTG